MKSIARLLIANRGEIACRVIHACRILGMESVAVYSEADRQSAHVFEADFALPIGGAPARDSYLDIGKIIAAARESKADAVHPGYGFLSENAEFAEACESAGLVWVGPSPAAIRALGSKTAARELAARLGVPIVPGAPSALASASEGLEAAARIGYPVLLKAAAGGGGKGMRVVHEPSSFQAAFERARSEAAASFGNAAVFLEKCLVSPRHIEIQVVADSHGHAIHLGERECSVQRRHQKLLEESPSPVVTPELRARMGEAALSVVRAAGYTSLGTVEFLLDGNGDFYFLEVNTRLQVEHPVTEMVTGIDLVCEQIRIAEGHPLSVAQEEVQLRGHAIECRLMAEDPFAGFSPSPGRIRVLREPRGPWVRFDGAIYTGYEVSLHYDPLLAKLIVWGRDRAEAIQRMRSSLRDTVIEGIRTTIPFQELLLAHPAFQAGELSTDFIERHMKLDGQTSPESCREVAVLAAALLAHMGGGTAAGSPLPESGSFWKQAGRLPGRRPWL